jgi:hypothetical protein
MTTQVLRYKCDLCGKVHMLRCLAELCEQMCTEEVRAAHHRNAKEETR